MTNTLWPDGLLLLGMGLLLYRESQRMPEGFTWATCLGLSALCVATGAIRCAVFVAIIFFG